MNRKITQFIIRKGKGSGNTIKSTFFGTQIRGYLSAKFFVCISCGHKSEIDTLWYVTLRKTFAFLSPFFFLYKWEAFTLGSDLIYAPFSFFFPSFRSNAIFDMCTWLRATCELSCESNADKKSTVITFFLIWFLSQGIRPYLLTGFDYFP